MHVHYSEASHEPAALENICLTVHPGQEALSEVLLGGLEFMTLQGTVWMVLLNI